MSINWGFPYNQGAKSLRAAIRVRGIALKYKPSSSSLYDDLMFSIEEMDLKMAEWSCFLMRVIKDSIKKTGRKLIFNGKEPVGFDKTKVECFNCHRRGHFARECRAPRNQGNMNGDAGSERIPVSTAKQYVNTATPKNRVNVSKSKINTFPKSHSPIRRPFYKSTVLNTRVSKVKVTTVKVNGVNTAGQTTVYTIKRNGVTTVKALAGCVWRPKMTDLNNGSKDNSGSWISKRVNYNVIHKADYLSSGLGSPKRNSLSYLVHGESKQPSFKVQRYVLTVDAPGLWQRTKPYLTDSRYWMEALLPLVEVLECKITCIGKIRTNKIDFEDVFFVKKLKFNLFSVLQMRDKKNNVLFTKTEFDDDACKKTVQEPASEYDQALKNVLDKMMNQEKEVQRISAVLEKSFDAQM
ncbi:ribonuclease H-like domain-containing protein [Tanacetum coccineum]